MYIVPPPLDPVITKIASSGARGMASRGQGTSKTTEHVGQVSSCPALESGTSTD
jgi:hypothetical protein